ncbi:unnamed protein product [Didymodactylos carnosus]|uniref:Uncharacterized protein n=1 Tax=Didymodactylos carnosus TaxID=1234261 RepID=A0A813VHR3_9BILA|nr:unnamed protein product [Didymodactylos carnosus]CAF3630920.1 unnamed protein product [Didymodactylos carnosus]
MSGGLGDYNKAKVANVFGIQLRPKHEKQRTSISTSTADCIPSDNNKKTENVLDKYRSICDFRTSNDLSSPNSNIKNTNGFNRSTSSTSTTPKLQPKKKPLDVNVSLATPSVKKSATSENVVKQQQQSQSQQQQQLLSSPSPQMHKNSSSSTNTSSRKNSLLKSDDISIASTNTTSNHSSVPSRKTSLTSTANTKLPHAQTVHSLDKSTEQPSQRKTSITQTASAAELTKKPSATTTAAMADDEKPLYRRQLSKTLDNATGKKEHQQQSHTDGPQTPSTKKR